MKTAIAQIKKYVQAANYLTVAQIYLQSNVLLNTPLAPEDIKPKLFGHWGTCPGINFVYGHLNYLVKKHNQSSIFVLGPGHGFPALQANLFLEKTLKKFYPEATHTEKGITYLAKQFSWPYGFASHSNPQAPGVILEGGELGYSLATAYGAILDNPKLLAVCMIGDGEAETGPLSSAWHINKLINPASNGAVLPILHRNGYKISGPSIFGRMKDEELYALFTGYGYDVHIVRGNDPYEAMLLTMEVCYQKIKKIQNDAKTKQIISPRFPMIILDTPKGWTGIKTLQGEQIEGTIRAHQVVAGNAKKNTVELGALSDWLSSYDFINLFDAKKGFCQDILDLLPPSSLRIGNNPFLATEKVYKPLHLPDAMTLAVPVVTPGSTASSSMSVAGSYIEQVFRLNQKKKNFRLFSPDETYSNRLDAIFNVTARAFVWPHNKEDKHLSFDGRVMEMLSEHNLHGMLQGYVLTGRHALLPTYEAFAQIFSSIAHQHAKFIKQWRHIPWRGTVASINYMLSSVAWRQEHNGYSHQNPSLISGLLDKQDCHIIVYFPADANSMLACLSEVLQSTNGINTIVSGKTPEPNWISLPSAKKALTDGLQTWDFASDDNPDIVVVGIGDYMTKEALAAVSLVKQEFPEAKIRFVNILKLKGKCMCSNGNHAQIPHIQKYFTTDAQVIVNFHGYPEVMKSILFDLIDPKRVSIHGYLEQGGTTTPFDMHIRNKTSRYHLASEIISTLAKKKCIAYDKAIQAIDRYEEFIKDHHVYIKTYGADPEYLENWQWGYTMSIKNNASHTLQQAKTIAMIGLSDNKNRPSYRVASYLQDKGFIIIPVNPNVVSVLGQKAYPSLSAVPAAVTIDIVDIFRKPESVVNHINEIALRGNIKTLWLQEGVSSKSAEQLAKSLGIEVISNMCIMQAHKQSVL